MDRFVAFKGSLKIQREKTYRWSVNGSVTLDERTGGSLERMNDIENRQ